MAITFKSAANLKPEQIADAIRASAAQFAATAKAVAEKTQIEGRIALSRQVLIGAQRANDLSKALFLLSQKIAPDAKPKAKAASRIKTATRKPVAKATARSTVKPRARKAVAA
jgi:hypothetical protein